MLTFFLILLCQDNQPLAPEALNAQLFVDGRRIELSDVRIKGIQPYAFEFRTEEGTTIVTLHEVSRISRADSPQKFKVLFLDGEEKVGRINNLSFQANPDAKSGSYQTFNLNTIERIHITQNQQLRSCVHAHYEAFTPYPYCPVCGEPLQLGPYDEDAAEKANGVLPTNTLRLDGRDPSSTAVRRN